MHRRLIAVALAAAALPLAAAGTADPAAFNVGTVDPAEAVRAQRAVLRHFFTRYL